MSKKYDTSFKKNLAKNIDRRKMVCLIYGVSRNGRKWLGYESTKYSRVKPKSTQKATKPKALYSHFTYGHIHDTDSTHKPWGNKTFRKTNHKGPEKRWVAKNKIIYVADILSSQVETPVMVPGI